MENRGHERQVSGLVGALERIQFRNKLELHKFNGGFVNALLELYAKKKYLKKKPNLIVGAGHKTHLTIILLSKILGGKSICLMKPSIPTKLFDLCIIPKHDNTNGANVFITQGLAKSIKK